MQNEVKNSDKIKNEFDVFGFKDTLKEGIQVAGFRTPSEIQSAVIPPIIGRT